MLTCSCPEEFYGDPGEWWFFPPETDSLAPFQGKRRKRCSSCKSLIEIGQDCLEFKRERSPWTDIEEEIMGQEIPMASKFFCERCSEIYLNLTEAGYCFTPADNMQKALKEYWKITDFDPSVYSTDSRR